MKKFLSVLVAVLTMSFMTACYAAEKTEASAAPASAVEVLEPAAVAVELGQELLAQGKTIAFAESCSGGLASSMLTDVSGSSAYMLGGAVTYTNKAKHVMLGVQQNTLDTYGAVSPETAREMAEGVRNLLGSDYGVSITGNAGPGASEGKPVGLVYMAVATENGVYCQEYHFTAFRMENKRQIAAAALALALEKLSEARNSKQ